MAHKTEAGLTGPIAVHCLRGSDRSSVYVALSCLALQIKNEARCDVFTAVRKLRAQRQGMVQSLVNKIISSHSLQSLTTCLSFFRTSTSSSTVQYPTTWTCTAARTRSTTTPSRSTRY